MMLLNPVRLGTDRLTLAGFVLGLTGFTGFIGWPGFLIEAGPGWVTPTL